MTERDREPQLTRTVPAPDRRVEREAERELVPVRRRPVPTEQALEAWLAAPLSPALRRAGF